MVIDNADDSEVFFGSSEAVPRVPESQNSSSLGGGLGHLIPRCPHGALLVTTRNKQAGFKLAGRHSMINVGPMDQEESIQLISKRLEDDGLDTKQTSLLAARLDYLPLALAQAAAFIQENSTTILKYIQLLDHGDHSLVELLSQPFEDEGRDSSVPNAVTATWIVSFKQINQQYPYAGDLLSLMSLFDRQGIPTSLLTYHQEKGQSQQDDQQERLGGSGGAVELEKALGVLKAFSFISESEVQENLNMHRLTQLVMRKWLKSEGKAQKWGEIALCNLSALFPVGEQKNWTMCAMYLPHVYAVLDQKGSGSTKAVTAEATLQHMAAFFMVHVGQWDKAEELLVQAVKTSKELLGAEHPDTLTSIANLASTFRKQGRWKEAEELDLQVIETSKRVLGAEHPDTLSSIANLASTFEDQGRWKEAEELELQVIETRKRVLGAEHPDTLMSMSNLALTWKSQGRWKEAEELESQVIGTRKRVLGAEHPDTLISMSNLALTFGDQGRWKEAEELELQVIETRKRVLGAEHPDTLTSMNNLALTFGDQGRWKEAEELELQVIETRKRVLGAEHPDTLTSMNNLAFTWKSQGRSKQAIDLLSECVQLRQQRLGANHPSTKSSLQALKNWQAEQSEMGLLDIIPVQ
jgi:tetratricopeptide (TPR) repeat protein